MPAGDFHQVPHVNVGSLDVVCAIATDPIFTEIVDHDEQDVGFDDWSRLSGLR